MLIRLIAALVLAPPVLAATYYGGYYFNLMVGLAAFLLSWEWNRLCGRGMGVLAMLVTTGSICAVILTSMGSLSQGLLLIAVCSGAILGFTYLIRYATGSAWQAFGIRPGWLAVGLVYIGVPCAALVWLRAREDGQEIVFWMFALVWAVDIGAYIVGRLVGGPKLAPSVSPNKTWAGLIGGIFCAALIGAEAAEYLNLPRFAPLIVFSAGMAVIEQGGDLVESWIKRRFSVKDMGSIIPGHGGLFDRVDGLLAVACATAIVAAVAEGNLFQWL